MQELPAAFALLGHYPQFVLRKKKTPINPSTLLPVDAMNPTNWLTAEQAFALSLAYGDDFGVGFVLTKDDPFWFIDIDHCFDGQKWSTLSNQLCQYFQGAAVEISQGGDGIHIIGTAKTVAEHKKKNAQNGLEFYDQMRIISLTGSGVIGNVNVDCTETVAWLIDNYFKPSEILANANWTDKPDPLARPLKTDQALIKRMLEMKNAGAVFGSKVSVKDLWEANDEKLSVAYPTFNEADTFDRSSADQALCNHLAFWTGKDCERMDKLFRKSALVRDKWTDREQYRRETILNAVAGCRDVYGSQKAAKENAQTAWEPEQHINNEVGIRANGGAEIVTYEQRPEFFHGHYFLTSISRVFCPDGQTRSQADYNAMYGTVEFAEPFGGKPITEPWKAYITAPDITRAEVYDRAYRPEYDFGVTFNDSGRVYVNEYVNQDGERFEGDATPFYNHIKIMLPNGNDADVLISWMAALIQYPGKKFLWSPFLQGVEGNGKSLIARILSYCIGANHVEDIDPEDFCNSGGKFNGYIRNHRLGVLEELKTGSRNQAEAALKRFIGNSRIQVQAKGMDQVTMRVCMNFLINSNHKDSILVTDHTRRFAVLYCAQQEVEDLKKYDMQRGGRYFSELFDWFHDQNGWGITANFLQTYQIPDKFNPATQADKAPETTSFLEAIQESKSVPHQAIIEALSSGKPGTLGSWASVQALREIIRTDLGIKPPSGKMMAKYLRTEGYVRHPALHNQGRLTRSVMQESDQRSVIYVKVDSIQTEITDSNVVTDAYLKAQGYTGFAGEIPKTEEIRS